MTTTSTMPGNDTQPQLNPAINEWIQQARSELTRVNFHVPATKTENERISAYQLMAGVLMATDGSWAGWPLLDTTYLETLARQPVYERLIAAAAYLREENRLLDSIYHQLDNSPAEENLLQSVSWNLSTIRNLVDAIDNLTRPYPLRPRLTFEQVGGALQRNLTGLRDLVRQHLNPRFEMALLVYEPERVDQEPVLVTTHRDIPMAMATLQALLNRISQLPQHDDDGQPLTTIIDHSTPIQ